MTAIPKKKTTSPANTIEVLQARLVELAEESTVITNTAEAENGRSLTDDETKRLTEINAEFERVDDELKLRIKSQALSQRVSEPNERKAKHDDVETEVEEPDAGEPVKAKARAAGTFSGGLPAGTSKGTFGFRSLGHWAMAARAMDMGNKPDQRIMNAPTSFGQEGINSDGGFAVPPDFRQQIMQLIENEENLSGRCDQQTTTGNSIVLPQDNVSPWDTTNGVQVNWTGEGKAITQSKPQLAQMETKLHKLAALVPITEELLEDVPALTGWLERKVPQKFNSELNNVIVNGNGIAKPQGMLNAGCVVQQAAEGGQTAGTIVFNNIVKMWARLYAPLRKNAVWLINQDAEPQLQQMTISGASSGVFPAYLPPGGLSGSPYATLMGKPCIALEECAAVGTPGDIILTDPTQYLFAMKGSGIKTDVSVHLYFDTGHLAFRFEMRVGGQSYWPTSVTRKNGTNTLSPIISLASR